MVNTKQWLPQKYFMVHGEKIHTIFFWQCSTEFMARYSDALRGKFSLNQQNSHWVFILSVQVNYHTNWDNSETILSLSLLLFKTMYGQKQCPDSFATYSKFTRAVFVDAFTLARILITKEYYLTKYQKQNFTRNMLRKILSTVFLNTFTLKNFRPSLYFLLWDNENHLSSVAGAYIYSW